MRHFLSRRVFCERFRFGRRQSYRIVPHHHGKLLDEGKLVRLLNECRMNGMPIEDGLPDLFTAEEVAEWCEGVSAKRILAYTKRKNNPLPCYRFNKNTLRFTQETFNNWISK